MPSLISKDGTAIVYDKLGSGPAIVLINGALAHRRLNGEKNLATLLAKHYTVIFYDRRGRGESKDVKPYSVEKEIGDIEALIDEAGGRAFLYGASSGAALALLAAAKLGAEKIAKLALYEPPYDAYVTDGKNKFADIKKTIDEFIHNGQPGEAISFFFESIGTPGDAIEGIKKSPEWNQMENVGHTLAYDFEVLGNGSIPVSIAKTIAVPTLVLDGEKSFDFMHSTAEMLGKTIPGAEHKTLKDQTHQVTTEAIFPVLSDFFCKSLEVP